MNEKYNLQAPIAEHGFFVLIVLLLKTIKILLQISQIVQTNENPANYLDYLMIVPTSGVN